MPISSCSDPRGNRASGARSAVRQVIRDQLEVQEQRIVRRALSRCRKKSRMATEVSSLQVEGAVDELETTRTALPQLVEFLPGSGLARKRPRGPVERREAELALERAAARGLHVDMPMPQILGRVLGVGQREVRERRPVRPRCTFASGRGPTSSWRAQPREGRIAPAGDDVVRQPADRLGVDLVADLRPTQHHDDVAARRPSAARRRGSSAGRSRCRRRDRRSSAAARAGRRRSVRAACESRTRG